MSRTVYYDVRGNEVYDDEPTRAQEHLEHISEKEKQMVTRYKQALYHAACDFARTKTNCGKCRCKGSCGCNPGTIGCRFALEDMWKHEAGIKDNHGSDDAQTHTSEHLADIESNKAKHETINHPDYYSGNGIEAIDVIEAWGLDFCLGNTVKYIARQGKKSDNAVEDLKKAAWYLKREIERMEQ